jgi:large subunit ribosomal protein L16
VLSPKRVKWRKQHRLRNNKGVATRGNTMDFGDFALMSTQDGWISSRQIEASRIAISRSVKRGGQMWLRIYPDHPITKKPAETRMGSGKGSVEYWVSLIKPGRILFEIGGVTREQAEEAFRLAAYKLPLRTKFLSRETEL